MMEKLFRSNILKKIICILTVSVMVLTQTDILCVNAMSDKEDTVTATESIVVEKEEEQQTQEEQKQEEQKQEEQKQEEQKQEEQTPQTVAEQMLAQLLADYFEGVSDEALYSAVMQMSEETFFAMTDDYETLLAALTEEDEKNTRLQNVIQELARGIQDTSPGEREEPAMYALRSAQTRSSAISLKRLSGSGEGFMYYHFVETTRFVSGTTYAFLDDVYGYDDAVTALGSGAVLKATNTTNNSLKYIRNKYGDTATVQVYVDVVTRGKGFDSCVIGGLYKVPNTASPAAYRYFCGYGGAQNAGPLYAYNYEIASLNYSNVSRYMLLYLAGNHPISSYCNYLVDLQKTK